MVRAKPSLKTRNVDVKNPSGYSNVLDLGSLSVGSFWIIGGYQRCADGGGVGDQGKPVDGCCRDKRNCGVRSRSRGSTASGRYLSDQLIELEVAKRPWPDSGGWRFAPRKGMLDEDRVGGPVTTAEIEAVAEPLGVRAILSDRPRPTEICPSGHPGCCGWPRRNSADRGLAPGLTERNVIQGEMGRKHTI
jgi:hypothetical protein